MRRFLRGEPMKTAVKRESGRPGVLIGLPVITTNRHADPTCAKCQRENSRSGTAARERYRDVVPVAPVNAAAVGKRIHISRTMGRFEGVRHLLRCSVEIAPEHAPTAARPDPESSIPHDSRAVAGRKDTVIRQRHEVLAGFSETHNGNPRVTAVMCYANAKNEVAAFNGIARASMCRIAEDESDLRGNKNESIIEAVVRRIRIRPYQLPGFAAICRFVQTGEVSGAGGHHDGSVRVKGLNRAKIQGLSISRYRARLPSLSAIRSSQNRAASSARPCHSMTDIVDSAKTGMAVRILDLPLGVCH